MAYSQCSRICQPHQQANDAGRSLPFHKSTFEAIVQFFHVPISYLQAVFDGSPSFARYETEDSLNGEYLRGNPAIEASPVP